jgi:protein TonB
MNRPAAASLGAERFVLTLIFSAIVHGVVLLGVGFTAPASAPATPTLDVILVPTATRDAPDQADYLANAHQEGGGDLDEKARPTAIANAPVQKPDPGNSEASRPIGTPEPAPERNVPMLASRASSERHVPIENTTLRPDPPLPASDALVQLEQEQARLAAEIDDANRAYAKRPRRKFISAQTREYAYAAYMRAWVARVERVGNLNYPREARQRQIHGELLLTVAMNRDGSVESIDVVRSSGYKVLDDAAVQIVRMSAPFNELPPLPDEHVDILHITRTWQFLPGDVLRHR